jgi:hypothetical protein
LENAILEQIAAKLKKFERDLNQGINNLQTEISNLNSDIAFLHTVFRVAGILSRIVAIV